jgi:hypothetical protein
MDLIVKAITLFVYVLDLLNTYTQICSFLLIVYRLPHLSFSRIYRFLFRPLTKTMNGGFTVFGATGSCAP